MSSSGWVPALQLDEVVLLDSSDREALRLPRVAAAVSARSLLALQLRFEQLLIDGAELEVRRDPAGKLHVAGLEVGAAAAGGDTALADWFFEQHEFVIRHGRLRWVDQQRGAPPLELSEVDLVIRNGLRTHALRLDATPPAPWGERFSLRGRFSQPLFSRAGDWQGWSGTLHADLPRADAAELRRYVDLPFELAAGDGAVRAWVDVAHGKLRGVTTDLALREVALRLAPELQPLVFERVEGRLVAQDDEDRLHVGTKALRFVTGEGVEWPASAVDLTLLKARGGGGFVSGQFAADRLDLALMASVAERLPVGEAVRKLLAGLAPQGSVQGLSARWDGALDSPTRYEAKGRLEGVSIEGGAAPVGAAGQVGVGRPGWRKANLDFEASERGGRARLGLDGGALVFPGVFAEPEVALDKFDAQLVWRVERARDAALPARISLDVRKARFANADAEGEFDASWHTGGGDATVPAAGARFPGVLDLSGRLTRGRAAAAVRYLPLALGSTALHYVEGSVLDGRITSATFKVKGDLWHFPFHRPAPGGGEFRVAAKVADVRLAYVPAAPGPAGQPAADPAWPVATCVAGDLVFDRAAMEIREASGRILGVDLSRVNGGVRNLLERPELRIEGQGRGPLADLLRYVNLTPVGEWTSRALSGASASGPADLKLSLSLPLDDLARSQVQGSVLLAGNELRLRPDVPPMANARGRVEFTHKGVAVVGASARLLGGEASFEGGTQPDGSLRFTGQGVATAEGLRRAVELGRVARLGSVASGQASYRLQLGFVRGASEFTFSSPLTGMALDLPAPLRKSAEVALPLRLQSVLLPDEPGAPRRDQLRIELGNLLQAQFVRDLSRDAPQVLRGGIAVQDALPQPASGVVANMRLASLDLDAWQSTAERLLGAGALAAIGAEGAQNGSGGAVRGADNGDAGYVPGVIALRAQTLVAGSRRLTQLVAGLSRDGADAWRATLDAEQLAGYVELRLPRGASSPGRVYARLSRLTVPPAETESVTQLLEQAPASVPALDIVVDDFDLRGKKLGRVEIEAVNRGGEGGREAGREWRLLRFAVTNPEASLTATGQWSAAAARRRMQLDFRLELADSGALLERLGMGRTLKGGKGRLQGQVSWAGSPLALHVPSLDGQMNLQLDGGQFLKAGPGVGRLLGVLSLQALPRRLALDFRDVFQEGFAFDNVTGDVSVRDGVASTNNLRMRGVPAAVLMEGSADIDHETQDLRVVVVPEINAGTASLAYAAINPAIGLGTFLAQMFLRRPLMAAGTREFHVSGPWSDPKVERVERAPGAPLPDLDTPPAAAASSPPRTP